MLKSIFQFLK